MTALLEMCFSDPSVGLDVNLNGLGEEDLVKSLFAENSGILVQLRQECV